MSDDKLTTVLLLLLAALCALLYYKLTKVQDMVNMVGSQKQVTYEDTVNGDKTLRWYQNDQVCFEEWQNWEKVRSYCY